LGAGKRRGQKKTNIKPKIKKKICASQEALGPHAAKKREKKKRVGRDGENTRLNPSLDKTQRPESGFGAEEKKNSGNKGGDASFHTKKENEGKLVDQNRVNEKGLQVHQAWET